MVGDGAVGKTCLLEVYKTGKFPEKYVPTVFDNCNKDITVDGEAIDLALWDTAGQEDYARIRPLSYQGCDVLLIVFSFDSKISFDNIKSKWFEESNRYTEGCPKIIVGTKSDLPTKEVTKDEMDSLAKSIGAAGAFECSAKTGANINTVFEEAVRASLRHKRKPRGGKSRCIIS